MTAAGGGAGVSNRVVNMRFNGSEFISGLNNAKATFGAFKKELNLDGATKGLNDVDAASKKLNFQSVAAGIEGLSGRFMVMATVGITALANITNAAVNAGVALVKSLTIDPIAQGFQEYELGLNSVQTILANTQHEGKGLNDVNAALQELNTYADKTIYNFAEMSRNIGTFTAAGVSLDTSTAAIKGIANLAAVSGSNSQQASTAMYQLSQALAAGKVSLMDWNSVVNAGMGGKVFQDALKETARASGVAIDDIIASSGSFRDSLQEGWLTSNILTDTLNKFTGDMSEADLAAKGYTEEQIAEIMKMSQMAQEAATKVKTMTQLVDTLKEAVGSGWAQTWQIIFGDFEEAKDFFTFISDRLGGMIGDATEFRNAMLQGWKDMGGREDMVNAIETAITILVRVAGMLGDAWKAVFPPDFGKGLKSFTEDIEQFMYYIAPTNDQLLQFQRIFQGLFSILDIGWFFIQQIYEVLIRLFGGINGGTDSVLEMGATFGDFLVTLRNVIKDGSVVNGFFTFLKEAATNVSKAIGGLLGGFKAFVDFLAQIANVGADKALESLDERLSGLSSIGKGFAVVMGAIYMGLQKVFEYAGPIMEKVLEGFKGLGAAIAGAFSGMDYATILDTINTGLFAGLVLMIKNFMGGGLDMDFTGGFLDSMKEAFGGLTDTLSAMQANLQAGTLMKIAIAVGILAASLAVLAMIDPVRLTSALTGMTVMFGQLVGALMLLQKVMTATTFTKLPLVVTSLVLLATAMVILSAAVVILSRLSWEELAKGMSGMAVMLGLMIGALKLLEKNTASIGGLSISLILFGAAINILVTAVTRLAGLSWEELAKGMAGLAVVMGLVVGFTRLLGNPKMLVSTAFGLILLGAALNIMVHAISTLAAMSWEDLGKGMAAFATMMLVLIGALVLMPKNLIPLSVGLALVAISLAVLTNALVTLGDLSWEQVAIGLVGLAGSLVILAVAMKLMQGSVTGMLAMFVAATAIMFISNALTQMAAMDWPGVGKSMLLLFGALAMLTAAMLLMNGAVVGMAAMMMAAVAITLIANAMAILSAIPFEGAIIGLGLLAGVLIIFGVAALVMTPILPQMMLLATIITLLGVGAMMAGIGIGLLALGFGLLATAAAAGGTAIIGVVAGLLGLIPVLFQQLGLAIVALAGVVEQGAPAIVAAVMAILTSLVEALKTLIPALIDLVFTIIMALVDALVLNIPLLYEAGLQLLTGILQGIADNIGGVVESATNVIVNFLDSLAQNLPRIVQAGYDLIIDFLNGIADAIRNNQARMEAAGLNVANAIVDGVISGISNGAQFIVDAAKRAAIGALNAAKAALGIKSPSREFKKVGDWSMQGMAIGIADNAHKMESSAYSAGNAALSAMKDALGQADDILDQALADTTIRPVLDLSQVRAEAAGYSDLFPDPTIQPNAALNTTSHIQADRANAEVTGADTNNGGGDTVYYFNQTNNSPKALAAVDIYRQTKNQFSMLKDLSNSANPHAVV